MNNLNIQETIKSFMAYQERIKALKNASSLIHWDAATGAPKKAGEDRAKMQGIISGEIFTLSTSEEMKTYLEVLEGVSDLDDITLSLVKYCKDQYNKFTKIPKEEYQSFSELCANATDVWEKAKKAADFNQFSPYLEKIVDYTRKFIEYREYKDHPYNTLLHDYEPDMTVEKLDQFFSELKAKIVPLVKKVKKDGKEIRTDFLKNTYPIENQAKFSNYILNQIGYDFDRGMLRESAHPFTLGFGPNDVRITTHYYSNNVVSSIFSSIHEGGHAIYEQNVSQNLSSTLLAEGTSMGIHESQSRFFENMLGRSLSFWKYFYPKLVEYFPTQLGEVSLEEFYEGINYSSPSLIRIESDELTYSLHIMIRYEIEKALMENTVDVKELPKLWSQKHEEYLGLTPSDDSEGVLQDIHWSDGSFGYFPSYALGNAYAAQFENTMKKTLDINQLLENGDFSKINAWLRDHIHQYGRMLNPNQILQKSTNEDLNPKYFMDYLEKKYSKIYF